MKLPKQSKPVKRAGTGAFFAEENIALSACPPGTPAGEIGTCYFDDGPPVNGFNCYACCAQRHGIAWLGPVTGAVGC